MRRGGSLSGITPTHPTTHNGRRGRSGLSCPRMTRQATLRHGGACSIDTLPCGSLGSESRYKQIRHDYVWPLPARVRHPFLVAWTITLYHLHRRVKERGLLSSFSCPGSPWFTPVWHRARLFQFNVVRPQLVFTLCRDLVVRSLFAPCSLSQSIMASWAVFASCSPLFVVTVRQHL